ncbi:MAG: PIN domain-containing protein [Firmicutes bacterium]|nr:PIN domain-containing protein [Bacillota bacterium]
MVRKVPYFVLVILFALGGAYTGLTLLSYNLVPMVETVSWMRFGILGASSVLGLILGVFLSPWIIRGAVWVTVRLEQILQKTPTQDLLTGAIGLIIGLIIANLIGSMLADFGWIGKGLLIISTILLGYLGLSVSVKKREEIWSVFSSFPKFVGKEKHAKNDVKQNFSKVVDTSVIIDGRIADLCVSGFIEGTLIVPTCVLEELRHIADSPDLLKRNRGRRGLDILNKMRKDENINVQIYEDTSGLEDIPEVDAKLVKLAQRLSAKIVTNDYNLNKVAELHEVKVLNINELANAVKPVVLPGEEMFVQVVKDGKEMGQGVAYLDDGTMIVVDGGKRYMGQNITVLVTSVLQTAAGRMIFAKPKGVNGKNASVNGAGQYAEVNMLG